MLLTYVRRELRGRLRQTLIVAIGLALAVALVVVVTAASAGVRDAQTTALKSVYGVGTDLTITQAVTAGAAGGQQFQFGAGAGATDGSSTAVSQENLSVDRGTTAIADTTLTTVQAVDGVADATATLSLTSVTFDGTVASTSGTNSAPAAPPTGGTGGTGAEGGGFGGGNFNVDSYTVTGVTPGATALGPLAGSTVTSGRAFSTADDTSAVALISQSYADSQTLAVGDTLTIKGTAVQIVGIISSDSTSTTLSDVYLPLTFAQTLSGLTGQITDVYVTADSAADVSTVQSAIEKALPDATVSSQADLAAGITGSLSSASSLVQRLGTWLSVAVLAAAFGLAVLFTISGVTRRTRDFGTLKAIGWSNGRVVRQVGTEALVQGAFGAVLGLAVGIGAVAAVNAAGITLSGSTAAGDSATGGAFGGPAQQAVTTTVNAVLHAPLSVSVLALAVVLALAGGLLAGVIGGWRASRLQPSAALRSLD